MTFNTSDRPIPGARAEAGHGGAGLVAAFTAVVWAACLAIGVAGLLTAPGPAAAPPPPATQPAVEQVTVDLQAAPEPPRPTPAVAAAQPAAMTTLPPDVLPAVPTVALPSAAVAFAVPLAGPARIGPAESAVPLARAGPAVQRIAFGTGVGAQPAPDYPPDARSAGQQGTVTVRFSVDPDGRVTKAWAYVPSPFPLLNDAAVDAVRDTWHFPPGRRRTYEVPIAFELNPVE